MRRPTGILLSALAGLLLVSGGLLASPGPRAARPAADVVTCEALWERPAAHLDDEVRFVVQFSGWVESWNPYLTRFGSGEYRAFTAWSDTQYPWISADYASPRARLFLRRGGAGEWALAEVTPYRRFEVLGKVRSVMFAEPWIEVLGVRPLVRQLGEGSVIHASRALEFMESSHWGRAEEELERALAAPLHETARVELERLLEACRAQLRD